MVKRQYRVTSVSPRHMWKEWLDGTGPWATGSVPTAAGGDARHSKAIQVTNVILVDNFILFYPQGTASGPGRVDP